VKILNEISRGGFGRVERVRLDDGRLAARKVFDPLPEILRAANEDKLRKRFQREVSVQTALNRDFVLPILSSDLSVREPWFLMPLAEKNLAEEIAVSRSTGEVPTKALADVLNALSTLRTATLSFAGWKRFLTSGTTK
jgi:serine/threonine-protein kinase